MRLPYNLPPDIVKTPHLDQVFMIPQTFAEVMQTRFPTDSDSAQWSVPLGLHTAFVRRWLGMRAT